MSSEKQTPTLSEMLRTARALVASVAELRSEDSAGSREQDLLSDLAGLAMDVLLGLLDAAMEVQALDREGVANVILEIDRRRADEVNRERYAAEGFRARLKASNDQLAECHAERRRLHARIVHLETKGMQ